MGEKIKQIKGFSDRSHAMQRALRLPHSKAHLPRFIFVDRSAGKLSICFSNQRFK
jgi:hypothetical protein